MADTSGTPDHALSRRGVVGTALVGAAAASSPIALAQGQQPATARAKGPPVWLDLDQKALDDAYDQAVYAPNVLDVNKRRAIASAEARKVLGEPQRIAYGESAIEKLDIYRSGRTNAPINVFVHGGAWRGGLAKDHAAPAELFVNHGAHLVVLDFINVIEAGGDLMPMATQVQRGIAWVFKNAASFGGNPRRLFISGHSSGAHLAGVATVTDWEKDWAVPADIIKGALLCSGMYDLKPVRLSARANYVKFTDQVEEKLSTQRHLARLGMPLILAYGTMETPEFQRQSRDFAAAVKAAGKPALLIVGEGYNHFEMPETLASPYGLLGRAVLRQMGLGAA